MPAENQPAVSGLYTEVRPPFLQRIPPVVRAIAIFVVLYFFLVSIKMMGGGFKSMGKGFADTLLNATSNPFVALFLGILATSIVQSSSATTSIIVALVANNPQMLPQAIPMIMGANIGTTVTNTIVSLGFIGRKEEFRRSFACGTVHDFFNYLCVVLMLPLEVICHHFWGTGPLQSLATRIASPLSGSKLFSTNPKDFDPVGKLVKPTAKFLTGAVESLTGKGTAGHWLVVAFSLILLFAALWAVTKLMRSLVLAKLEVAIDRSIGRSAALGLTVGVIFTAIVQSSSVTTSILVPLAATGIVNLEQVFPVTVGANIGTTATALLAALAGGGPAGLTIAIVHLLFNVIGAIIFVPVRRLRNIPIRLAGWLAGLTMKSRWYAIAYVIIMFFALPALLYFLT